MSNARGQSPHRGKLLRAPQGLLRSTGLSRVAQIKNHTAGRLWVDLELEPFFCVVGLKVLFELDWNALFHRAAEIRFNRSSFQHWIQIPQRFTNQGSVDRC